mgnify:CR=1 FL=1|jgi:AbiV family abortive infection protein
MTPSHIPEKYLKEGFKKQIHHIENLLESSQLLYDSKKYPSSLSLSILALEEITKLRLIREHLRKKEGISEKDWKNMKKGGSHKMKLVQPSMQRKKRLEDMDEQKYDAIEEFKKSTGSPFDRMTFSEMKKATEKYSMMAKLDKIKQACFYLDWDGKNWVSAKLNLTKRELESLTFYSLNSAKWYLNQTILYTKYTTISTDPKSESYQKFTSDPLHKKDLEFKKSFMKPKIKTKFSMAYKIIEKY